MRRILLCCALFLLPTAAFAEGWTAQMVEDEGGPIMMASVTAPAHGDITPELEVTCAGEEGVNLRYLMPVDAGEPGSEADFLFENEAAQAKLHMALEDMDGAFAAYFPKTAPIVVLLQTGDEVFVSDASGNFPAQKFVLKGSSKAIATVLKGCQ
jgi:hypothetical protein